MLRGKRHTGLPAFRCPSAIAERLGGWEDKPFKSLQQCQTHSVNLVCEALERLSFQKPISGDISGTKGLNRTLTGINWG